MNDPGTNDARMMNSGAAHAHRRLSPELPGLVQGEWHRTWREIDRRVDAMGFWGSAAEGDRLAEEVGSGSPWTRPTIH
jgi:hypothetical protein